MGTFPSGTRANQVASFDRSTAAGGSYLFEKGRRRLPLQVRRMPVGHPQTIRPDEEK